MSYHIYTTEGIILKRTGFGEANVLLHVFTKEFGLIIASARSARLSVSKLRPALQEYTLVLLSLVKGKNGWKITNVLSVDSFFFGVPKHTHKVMSQVSFVLLQMIQGESADKDLFQIVKSGFEYLKNIDKECISLFEPLIIIRILNQLGYVVKDSETSIFLENPVEWDEKIINLVMDKKIMIVGHINKALKESHL